MSASHTHRSGPVLVCFDGSDDSAAAIEQAAALLTPRDAVVLTVWESVQMRLRARGLAVGQGVTYVVDEGDLDAHEQAVAREAAGRGARSGQERGWDTSARTEQAEFTVWQTVVQVADELDASLIVCGARGLNPFKRAILGSVSEGVLHHSHRPTLISPQ